MTEHTKGKSTNLSAFNGEIHVGDYVLYEDGWLTFTVQIVEQDGVCGFFLEDEFHPLLEFVRDMSLDKEKCDAAIDFTILNQKGEPQ